MGGKVLGGFPFISAVCAEISPHAYASYRENGVCISAIGQVRVDDGRHGEDAARPDLRRLHAEGITGQGVGIAVIDTGIYPHIDFCVPQRRIAAFVDFINGKNEPYDNHGHGTAVAGIACAGGRFYGGVCGAAPQSHIVALKAVDDSGSGNVLGILTAMQWIYTNFRALRVKVVNMSLGSDPMGEQDPLVLGVRALTSVGLTVVASAGNAGPGDGTLKSPGVSEAALTVGGAEKGARGWYAADFSSRGTLKDGKPDLIAPAVDIPTCKQGGGFTVVNGTSAAAPLVSGVCALILQQHGSYAPARVKQEVLALLQRLDCPQSVCGAGLLNPF